MIDTALHRPHSPRYGKLTKRTIRWTLWGLLLFPRFASGQAGASYPPVEPILRIGAPTLTIGRDDIDGPFLFGTILGVALDNNRNIYVLDGSDHSIRIFSPTGDFIGSAGRPGRGPGDLRDPLMLWHDGATSVYVVDRYEGISRFDRDGARLIYRTRFGSELRPSAVCGLGDDLVVAGYRDGHILHLLSRTGALKRSLGDRFRTDSIPGIQEVHDGAELVLTCDAERQRIYVAEGAQAIVRAYQPDGRLAWQTELPEYDGYSVRINRNPVGIAVMGGSFRTRTAMRLGPDLLVVQARRETMRRDPTRGGAVTITEGGIVTYVLSASSGRVLTRQTTAPLYSAERGGIVAGLMLEPFPRVFLARRATP